MSNSVTTPAVVTRPIRDGIEVPEYPLSVNHTLPSGPVTIPVGFEPAVNNGYSVTVPGGGGRGRPPATTPATSSSTT